jgi:orotidine-5'-phosphate decarboxylase
MSHPPASSPPAVVPRWTALGRPPLAVALDAPDGPTALRWAVAVAPHVAVLKVGLELFYREGPGLIHTLRDAGVLTVSDDPLRAAGPGRSVAPELFLDLKLHDIPATVAGGVRSVARLNPRFLTVHAAGGPAMVRAAVDAAGSAEPGLRIAAVTVLTSLGEADLAAVGLAGPASDAVRRLAVLAVSAGAQALVCSPQEVRTVRAEVGSDVTLITPGIRPPGSARVDQVRVATPAEAVEAGADLLVVGRPVTAAADPAAAAAALGSGLPSR